MCRVCTLIAVCSLCRVCSWATRHQFPQFAATAFNSTLKFKVWSQMQCAGCCVPCALLQCAVCSVQCAVWCVASEFPQFAAAAFKFNFTSIQHPHVAAPAAPHPTPIQNTQVHACIRSVPYLWLFYHQKELYTLQIRRIPCEARH